MIAKPASIFVLALAAFGAVSASPLTRRDDPPTGNLTGTAEYSYFDGTSAWYVFQQNLCIVGIWKI